MRFLALVLFSLTAISCDDLTTESLSEMFFEVRIQGTNIAPADATGTASPRSLTLTLVDILWTPEATGTEESLISEADAALRGSSVVVLDRERVLVQNLLADPDNNYIGFNFSGLKVQFGLEAEAEGKYQIQTVTLPGNSADQSSFEVTSAETFTFNKGKGRSFNIDVEWYRTRTTDDAALTDAFTVPNFANELKEN